MYYNIAKRILCMSLKFCIVMYKYYGPVAFNCKIKYLYCIVLYCYHSNRLRCIVYFSTSTYICSCNLSIANRGK